MPRCVSIETQLDGGNFKQKPNIAWRIIHSTFALYSMKRCGKILCKVCVYNLCWASHQVCFYRIRKSKTNYLAVLCEAELPWRQPNLLGASATATFPIFFVRTKLILLFTRVFSCSLHSQVFSIKSRNLSPVDRALIPVLTSIFEGLSYGFLNT